MSAASGSDGHVVRIDRAKALADEAHTGHNRWHPEITPVLRVEPGQLVTLETRDAFDGQFTPSSTPEDVAAVNLNLVHPLTGPVHVEGAEPGDLLVVEVVAVEPQPQAFTVQVPGFGFLRDVFPEPYIVHWQIADGVATSEQLPDVRVPGAPFMGVMGVAPSRELLSTMAARERDLADRGGMVLLPDATDAVPAEVEIADEALRTIPPRETGGNVDIKQLTAGARVLLPLSVTGALFSAGDAHFAQGDGEVCGTAIEMGATFSARFELRKGVAARRGIRDTRFELDDFVTRPEPSTPRRCVVTTGLPIQADGGNAAED
ncbi:MAG TPA: acetamidase/formamidase family protein, partial [Egibacteraceae bacterium]|nr:acetamidase/formamidase family protein [Egibacteraceae bacterium]